KLDIAQHERVLLGGEPFACIRDAARCRRLVAPDPEEPRDDASHLRLVVDAEDACPRRGPWTHARGYPAGRLARDGHESLCVARSRRRWRADDCSTVPAPGGASGLAGGCPSYGRPASCDAGPRPAGATRAPTCAAWTSAAARRCR